MLDHGIVLRIVCRYDLRVMSNVHRAEYVEWFSFRSCFRVCRDEKGSICVKDGIEELLCTLPLRRFEQLGRGALFFDGSIVEKNKRDQRFPWRTPSGG